MAQAPVPPFTLRSLGLSVYLPTFLFAIGQGAVIPFTPLLARELHSTVAMAAFIVALRGLGTMLFDIPAGILVGAVGERWAMVIGTTLLTFVAVGCALATSPVQLAVLMFVMGWAWAIWGLARLTYVTEQAPTEMRGRALSLVGGTNRAGNFVGPFIGAVLGMQFGLGSTFYLQAVLAVIATVFMFLLMRSDDDRPTLDPHGSGSHGFVSVMVQHRKILATAGVATLCLGVLRSARQAVIPLWGEAIGLSPVGVANIFGISNGMDMLLFYPTGSVMDRWGRKWVAIPCMVVLGIGMMMVPLAHDTLMFAVVALFTGVGNGMGAGIVMTLGADFSPAQRRAEFLGVWRLVSDIGQTGGPAVLGVLAGVASLGAASVVTGVIGLTGATIMWLLVPEPLPPERRRGGRPVAPPAPTTAPTTASD